MAKREKLTDEALEAVCTEFLRSALGGPDTDVSACRVRNLIAYNALAEGDFAPPEVADRSDFVATDVADTVEGMLPQVMKLFVSSDNAVEFEATKQGGEEVAKTITGYINHLFYTRNDGLNVIYDWFKDALIQKVGFVQVWAEEEQRDERQTFQGVSPEQVAMLMQSGHEIDGEPMQDEHGITVTVVDKRTVTAVKVAAIAPHEMRIDPTARWGAEPAAIGRVYMRRKFELEEDGFDVSEIPVNTMRGYAESIQELGETPDWSSTEIHDSHRMVECADIYAQLDRNGDGVAEWIQVRMVGNTIGQINGKPAIAQVDDHPFAYICPIPRPHAFFGDCPADYAYTQQKLRTNLMRALFDNVYLTVNQRTYVNTRANVNIDDLLESRPGGVVRGEGAPNEAFSVMAQPNLGAPAFELNEWVERWGESRTGFNRYSKGTDADALNKTATGVQILTAKADMRIELMSRFFAQGVRQMFAKMLKLAVEHQDQQDWFNVNGSWVPVNPSEWKDRFNVKINVGLGHGTNEQKLARIMAMVPMIQMGLEVGSCTAENVSALIRTAATANEFKNVDEFAAEKPAGPPVQQLQQQMQDVQKQLQQCQQELQQAGEQLQQAGQENAQLKLANANKEAEIGLKHHEIQARAQEPVADDGGAQAEQARKDFETQRQIRIAEYDALSRRMAVLAKMPNASGEEVEDLDGNRIDGQEGTTPRPDMGALLQQLTDSHHALAQAMTAPKRIVRDEQGDIIGAESA